jgi:hypothetical protein
VLLGQLQTRLQKLDLQLRTRMLCEAFVSFLYGLRLFIEAARTTDQLKERPAVP